MLYPSRVEEESKRQDSRHPKESRLVVKGSDSRCGRYCQKPEKHSHEYVDPE